MLKPCFSPPLIPGEPFHVPWVPGSGLHFLRPKLSGGSITHLNFDYLYSIEYNPFMITLRQTETFSRRFSSLKDRSGRVRILSRLDRIAMGNFGDVKAVGEGVSEIRIDSGPGYRLYFVRREKAMIFLLCGGDKSTQDRDITRAKDLAKTLE